jgi:hypothetical protein
VIRAARAPVENEPKPNQLDSVARRDCLKDCLDDSVNYIVRQCFACARLPCNRVD